MSSGQDPFNTKDASNLTSSTPASILLTNLIIDFVSFLIIEEIIPLIICAIFS
jgi:hypothetical protein